MVTFSSALSKIDRTARFSRKIGIRSAIAVEMSRRAINSTQNAKLVRLTMPGFPAPVYLRGGTSDVQTFIQIILDEEYDMRSTPQFRKLDGLYRKAGADGRRPLIIDCGANIGLSAIWFSLQFPEAQILAVEPAADNIEIAKLNLHAYPNVTLLQGAVWDRPSQLKISDTTVSPWAYQVTESQDHVSVKLDNALKTFTISELMDAANEHEVLIAKIDIEGAEANLFRSNIEWARRTHLIAIELHDWMLPNQRTSTPFLRTITHLDFELFQRGENLFVFIDGLSH